MNQLYHWVGFAVVWAAAIGGGLWLAYYTVRVPIALFEIALRKYDWLNYRWFFSIKLFRYFVLRQDIFRPGSPEEFAGWVARLNDRGYSRSAAIRKKAPFYRWFYAYVIRERRRQWQVSWGPLFGKLPA